MGRKVVAMETKVAAMLARVGAGSVSVTVACAELGISRQTYYKYRARFDAEGVAGLVERSRRPRRSPASTPEPEVAWIVKLRAVLASEGWDNGATSVYYRMLRDGLRPPSRRTVHRVLVREGLVVPQPGKRPRSSFHGFEFPATDDCWQLDAWEYRLADGETVVVFELEDDRSRYLVAARAWAAETTAGAWQCVAGAVADYGVPLMLLCDNSLAFTGRLRFQVVLFERNLAGLGVQMINSRPGHPQTCGKDERHHQTAQRWLRARPTAVSLAGLQALLDEYRDAYNDRPHQSLAGATPREQRAASRRVTPLEVAPVSPPTTVATPTVTVRGAVRVRGHTIGLGVEFAGQRVIVFQTGDHLQVFWRHHRIAALTLEPGRSYYSTRPRSSRRRSLPR
jgi:leucine-zipper of insertion element IS481/Integrase core domain